MKCDRGLTCSDVVAAGESRSGLLVTLVAKYSWPSRIIKHRQAQIPRVHRAFRHRPEGPRINNFPAHGGRTATSFFEPTEITLLEDFGLSA